MRRLALLIWLVVVWVALVGDLTVGNVIAGLLLGGAIVFVVDRRSLDREHRIVVRPWPTMLLVGYFAVALVQSTWAVVVDVMKPRLDLHEAIIVIPLVGVSDFVATIVANFITLTPGTLTIDSRREPGWIAIHALQGSDPDAVRADVNEILVRVARAFSDRETLRRIEAEIAAPQAPSASPTEDEAL